jgi:hypothetical protein
MSKAGCLGSVLVLALVIVVGIAAAATTFRPFPSPTPLPRADGRATDEFAFMAGETLAVRRAVLDVPAEALPVDLGEPITVHLEADIEVPPAEPVRLAVIDGSGTDMVRQQRVSADIDVRWEIRCAIATPCHEEFDLIFSRSAAELAVDVRWRLKAQIRYPTGGLVPPDAALMLAVRSAPAPQLEPALQASSEAEALVLSADQPFAIRQATIELTDASALRAADLAGLRAFVRAELTAVPAPTAPPVGDSWLIPARDPAPIEVLVWTEGGTEPEVARKLTAPGVEQTDQLELGSGCVPGRPNCSVEVVLFFRLLSDRTDGTHELTWRLDGQLLADEGGIDSDTELIVTAQTAPPLEAFLQTQVQQEVTLTKETRFGAPRVTLIGLLDPGVLTPEMPFLPVLSVADLTASASVSGSTRQPLIQVGVSGAEYGEPGSLRQFRPDEGATLRFVGFGGCTDDRPCSFQRTIDIGVIDVAEHMTSNETVTVTLAVQLTVLGSAAAEVDGVVLSGEFR